MSICSIDGSTVFRITDISAVPQLIWFWVLLTALFGLTFLMFYLLVFIPIKNRIDRYIERKIVERCPENKKVRRD
jgi:hypothetical protein